MTITSLKVCITYVVHYFLMLLLFIYILFLRISVYPIVNLALNYIQSYSMFTWSAYNRRFANTRLQLTLRFIRSALVMWTGCSSNSRLFDGRSTGVGFLCNVHTTYDTRFSNVKCAIPVSVRKCSYLPNIFFSSPFSSSKYIDFLK